MAETTATADAPNPDHKCIHCGSNHLSYAEHAQGFGAGKAVAGAVLFGPLGLVAGAINKNKVHVTVRCNDCLQTFTADKMLAPQRTLERQKQNRQFIQNAGLKEFVGFSVIIALPLSAFSYLFLSSISFGVRFLWSTGLICAMLAIQKTRAIRK